MSCVFFRFSLPVRPCLAAATSSIAGPAFKSPAWLSIESPVNPYDPTTRGDALLVHTQLVRGNAQMHRADRERRGLVNGARRSLLASLRQPGAPKRLRRARQWPSEGTWLLRISLRETTALVSLDAAGTPTGARSVTETSTGMPLPRAVSAREIDSALTAACKAESAHPQNPELACRERVRPRRERTTHARSTRSCVVRSRATSTRSR